MIKRVNGWVTTSGEFFKNKEDCFRKEEYHLKENIAQGLSVMFDDIGVDIDIYEAMQIVSNFKDIIGKLSCDSEIFNNRLEEIKKQINEELK